MGTPETNLPPTEQPETSAEPVAAPPEAAPAVAEDLRTPWGWAELGLFALVALASLLVLQNVLALLAITLLGVKSTELEKFATTNTGFVILRQLLWFAMLMFYLFASIRLRWRTPFWSTIGWRELRIGPIHRYAAYAVWLLGGGALAVFIQLASALIRTKTRLPIEAFFQNRQSVLLLMGVATLIAPVVEETIFRGYLYPVLARSFGVVGGVL